MKVCVYNFNELTTNALYEILKARVNVFVVEQNCPYPELDDIDYRSIHVYLEKNDKILGYCRVFQKEDDIVQIGRVLSTQRNKHYGYDVMKKGIEVSKTYFSAKQIYIEAQTYAIPFYEKFDFVTISEPFLEDGIPHVKMIKSL